MKWSLSGDIISLLGKLQMNTIYLCRSTLEPLQGKGIKTVGPKTHPEPG